MATAIRRKSQLFSKNLKPTRSFGERIEGADRLGLKRAFAEIWLKESPFQKYRYTVEICDDGQEIYLVRPTRSHGLDFEVRVKGFKSKSGSERPAHGDVTKDLQSKIASHPELKSTLYEAVCEIYDCKEPEEVISKHPELEKLTIGLPIDKSLRIIKWLFIEQDLTYWLGTGRNMFMSGIEGAFGLTSHLFVEDMPKHKCSHKKKVPRHILKELPFSQGGVGRHKCAACAFSIGYADGTEGHSTTLDYQCRHHNRAPKQTLDSLPFSQSGPGRHKCVVCAYHEGLALAKAVNNRA